ncbi:polyamine ABC transporter substrate-binding protein [Halocalculus aciditolerans]|nr:spermidine/putrescine ABC transporter substrate-binding protein [Halocalculus aciditolerans]
MAGLAGCSGGDGGDGTGGTTTSGTTTGTTGGGGSAQGSADVRAEWGLPDLDYDVGDSLNVFQWTDYWPSGTVEIFEKAYGVNVNVSNYASNEEMFNKLKAGGTGQFDLIFPSDYMVNILASQGMIQQVNLDKLSNFDNLERRWIDQAPYDPDPGRWSVPYQWGTSGCGWNTNMTPDIEYPFSWDLMWSDEYGGQMTMLNDMRETIGASLKRLGYSLNSTKESEIQEAKEALIEQKPLLTTYSSVSRDAALQNEQASPVHLWSGDAFSAYWATYTDGESPIGYRVPKEGGVVWVDTAAVTKEAANVNAAHAFITFFLNAEINAKISNYVYYPTPNAAAKEYIDDAALNNPAIYPPDEVMQNLEFIRNIGQATQLYSEAWTEIQNA